MSMNKYKFTELSVKEAKEKLLPVFEEHWNTTIEPTFNTTLNPAWEYYNQLEQWGALVSICVKYDGEIVGYCIGQTTPHLFAQHMKVACINMLYISDSHRSYKLLKKMLTFVELYCKLQKDSDYMIIQANTNERLQKLLARLEYKTADISMIRGL